MEDEKNPAPFSHLVGAIAALEAQNERLREALELIADTDIKPFRCAAIARNALAAEDQTSLRGTEAAIRKAGQVAIDELIDGWSDTLVLPGSDDLADYMTRIVDACVRALATTEGLPDA